MPQKCEGGRWRQSIIHNLKRRNLQEYEFFKDLILAHNRLFDQCELIRCEAKQLSYQNEKLQEMVQSREGQNDSSTSMNVAPIVKKSSSLVVQQLEQKIYKLQEELTNLHRTNSERSQHLIEANTTLNEKNKHLATVENELTSKQSEVFLLKEELTFKESKIQEIEALNQLLRDEYQALNLGFISLEEKYKSAQEEIHQLIERWMELKEKDAEKMNAENETASRKRQEMLEKNLKEACLEPKVVVEEGKFSTVSPICINSALPSKAYLIFDGHEGEVNALVFSPRGKLLASGGSDRRIKLWDINNGTVDARGVLSGSNAGVNAIDFDCDESLVLGASNDFACRVWTSIDLRLRHTLTGHSGKVMASKFFLESSKVVTGSHDRTIKIWDLRSRACTKTFFPGSSCNDVAVSDSQSTTVVSGHFDKTVKFWDIRKDEPTSTVSLPGRVTSVSLSKDGLYLLCSVRDDSLRIIDLRENRLCKTLTHDGFHLGADYIRATFSPDGAYVACGCNSGAFHIWDVATSQLVKTLNEHSCCVIASTWHPNGKILASCDKNKKIVSWGDF